MPPSSSSSTSQKDTKVQHEEPVMATREVSFHDEDIQKLPLLHHFPSWLKWLAAALTFVSGVVSSYSFKIQNKQVLNPCGDDTEECNTPIAFNGPFLQTFLMWFGELLCLGIWYIDRHINAKKGKAPWTDFSMDHGSFNKPPSKWWPWFIPACLDTIATVCANIAMTITYASTVTMLRNFLVVICALMQLGLIRRALRIHEWIGVVLITAAMVLTAIPAIQDPEQDEDVEGHAAWVGILLAIVGTTVQGLQIIFEEYLFVKGRMSPVKAIGIEGIAGIILTTAVLFPVSHKTNMENVKYSWYQWAHSWRIILVSVFYLVACITFNGAGLATTKLGGGLLRSIMFALRAPAIWILDLIVGWISFDYYNLAAIFVFLIGFAIHVRLYPHSKLPGLHRFLSIPWHWCCTKRELDEDYVPVEDNIAV